MSYIGNPPAEAYTNTVKDSFSGDGSTVAFTLSRPSLTNDVRVVVENVIQDPTVAYSVSGTTLTFTSAPPSGTNNIYVVHLGPAVQTAVPPGEISAATTFASNVTVQGAFTSRGIDDNATSTAMTLDTSRNLLVGKTSANLDTVGAELRSNGIVGGTVSGGAALWVNRTTSDGDVAIFSKDGTTFGKISSRSGVVMQIGSNTNSGLDFGTSMNPMNAGSITDATVDLGYNAGRFRNLYLSGGVYLGGTGAANYLDDYEEGTWTPGVYYLANGVSATMTNAEGAYTKIGRLVNVVGMFVINSTNSGSGNALLDNLPFTIADVVANTSVEASGVVSYFASLGTNVNTITLAAIAGSVRAEMYIGTTASSAVQSTVSTFNANAQIRFSLTYYTT